MHQSSFISSPFICNNSFSPLTDAADAKSDWAALEEVECQAEKVYRSRQ
jgi:hypothetical protein